MDRRTVQELSGLLQKTLTDNKLTALDLGRYGVVVGRGRYNGNSVVFQVEIVERAADGTALSREAMMLRELGPSMYGIPKEALDKPFTYNGHRYEAVGLAPKSFKYPVLAKRIGIGPGCGTVYKLPASAMGGNSIYSFPRGVDRTELAEARGS